MFSMLKKAFVVLPESLQTLLDDTLSQISIEDQGHTTAALNALTIGLGDLRDQLPQAEWRRLVTEGRKHDLLSVLHEDPFTKRAYSQPDGYPGDARLIDFIYGLGEMSEFEATSDRGLRIYTRAKTQ